MKIQYREELRLSNANIDKLEMVNIIIDEYAADGYTLTLRQLYYQLVSRDIIPNKTSEYAKLGNLIVKGRMAGYVDWEAIEDRIRTPHIPYSCDDIPDALDDVRRQYRLDRQENQDVYIELWVEKDALSGVLKPITSHYHVRLMVNRGYSSCSAMHDAYRRISDAERQDKEAVILYLGDHDPSGLDMIRDIEERLNEFGAYPDVVPIGLTMKQIEEHRPPPNPAKITDPRAKKYIEEFGRVSWEVDALNPQTLNILVRSNIEGRIDMDMFQDVIDREDEDKETLSDLSVNI